MVVGEFLATGPALVQGSREIPHKTSFDSQESDDQVQGSAARVREKCVFSPACAQRALVAIGILVLRR